MNRCRSLQMLLDLPVGSEMYMSPRIGETVSGALKRLKHYGSKYAKRGRAYRMKIEGAQIRIQGLPTGVKQKLADWLLMVAGDRLLLSVTPTKSEVTAAKKTAYFLTNPPYSPDILYYGYWEAVIDRQGQLIAECYVDRTGKNVSERPSSESPLRMPWATI